MKYFSCPYCLGHILDSWVVVSCPIQRVCLVSSSKYRRLGFDRAVRLARLFAFGFPQADITLIADETLKVQVQKPKYWKSVPGGHAFIHFWIQNIFGRVIHSRLLKKNWVVLFSFAKSKMVLLDLYTIGCFLPQVNLQR